MQFLRTKTLVGPYEHVLRDDHALDQKAEGFDAAYDRATETGKFAEVPRTGDHEPVVWELQHLSEQKWRFIADLHDKHGLNTALYEAVALALVAVRGLAVPFELERGADKARRGWEAVSSAALDQLAPGVVNELGLRVVAERNPRDG